MPSPDSGIPGGIRMPQIDLVKTGMDGLDDILNGAFHAEM